MRLPLLASSALLASTAAHSCYKAGERSIGAPGYPDVHYAPCCSGLDPTGRKGWWGKFCDAGAGNNVALCAEDGARNIGADGYLAVVYVPCCNGHQSTARKGDWGKFCDGGSGSGGSQKKQVAAPAAPAAREVARVEDSDDAKQVAAKAKAARKAAAAAAGKAAAAAAAGKAAAAAAAKAAKAAAAAEPVATEMGRDKYPDEVSLYGISFSPFGLGGDQTCGPDWETKPDDTLCLSVKKVKSDLAIIRQHTKRLRTYSLICEESTVATLAFARETGMTVMLGVWIENDEAKNALEFAKFKRVMAKYGDVVSHVIVGNEPVFIVKVPEATVAAHIKRLRGIGNSLPKNMRPSNGYGTADIWNAWMDQCVVDTSQVASFDMSSIVSASDFIGLNSHPFFGGAPAKSAPNLAADGAATISARYGGKEVIITETGYPTGGPTFKPSGTVDCPTSVTTVAVPGKKALETYLAGIEQLSRDRGLKIFHFEPFDSNWKQRWEAENNTGETDESWGILGTCDRTSKGIKLPSPGAK